MNQPSVRYFVIKNSGKISLVHTLQDAQAGAGQDGYLWLDYCDPTTETLAELIHNFGIHPLSIEDCINEEQLPKLDIFPNYSFMIFNIFEPTLDELLTHELDLLISDNFLITVSHRDQTGTPLLQTTYNAIEREIVKVKLGPSFLMHLVVDMVVDHKFQAIVSIEEKLDRDEDNILNKAQNFNPVSLMNSRRDLQVIRRSLFHERELVAKLIRQDSPFIVEKSLVYYRDVYDHLSKYYEISESARDLVTSLMEIHLSMLSNQLAQSSNRTNKIMRRLTLITTIFMPLTLIASIGGMSEFTMMVGQENWKIAYLVLLLVMVVVAVINYILLLRMEKQLPKEETN
ncbi:MAG: magnesium transporter CorA family protein [Anaerolineaceae bacterium]